jgi:pilus assembly protein FimV
MTGLAPLAAGASEGDEKAREEKEQAGEWMSEEAAEQEGYRQQHYGPLQNGEEPHGREQTKAPAEEEEELPRPVPEISYRQTQDGRKIIDYQPPSLDPNPAPREETPMQPSVEFSSSFEVSKAPPAEETPMQPSVEFPSYLENNESAGNESKDFEASSDEEIPLRGNRRMEPSEEWEVEEVSFPPLGSAVFGPGGSPLASLDEARRLLEVGDNGKARELLEELAESDERGTRAQAQALIDRHDL